MPLFPVCRRRREMDASVKWRKKDRRSRVTIEITTRVTVAGVGGGGGRIMATIIAVTARTPPPRVTTIPREISN